MKVMTRTLIATTGITLALTGCGGGTSPADPAGETATAAAVPTPTEIQTPDPREACQVELSAAEGSAYDNRAVITCGVEDPITLDGDFRQKVTNHYDAVAAHGIERILVVDDEIRVWTQGCFLAYNTAVGEPQPCQASNDGEPGQDEPLTPEDLDQRDA